MDCPIPKCPHSPSVSVSWPSYEQAGERGQVGERLPEPVVVEGAVEEEGGVGTH